MACTQIPDLPVEAFHREVIQKWIENRVPLSASLELDLRCNLECVHCYRNGEWPAGVLTPGEVQAVLDQIAEAGTLWLLFTGGEVFLRRDFFEIYEHARRLGLLVTVFSNGTMVTETVADRFAERPPYSIEISLYGYTRQTYEAVTGVQGSWAKCYRGVELLAERGLPLKLKTVVMRTNRHELEDMYRYAERLGAPFKYDTLINPNFNGSMAPCNVRLDPEEVVELDFLVPDRERHYRDYFEPRKDFVSDRLFSCGAGSRTFHVDPYGMMKMCLLLREPEYSLRKYSFRQVWDEFFPQFYNRKRRSGHPCNDCNLSALCGKCPAWSQMEKGDLEARVDYTCEVGHRRAKRLGYYDGTVEQYSRDRKQKSEEILLPALRS